MKLVRTIDRGNGFVWNLDVTTTGTPDQRAPIVKGTTLRGWQRGRLVRHGHDQDSASTAAAAHGATPPSWLEDGVEGAPGVRGGW